MPEKAQYATAHRIRFREIRTPEMLQLTGTPARALSWKIGPSGGVGPDGYRLPADLWCAKSAAVYCSPDVHGNGLSQQPRDFLACCESRCSQRD